LHPLPDIRSKCPYTVGLRLGRNPSQSGTSSKLINHTIGDIVIDYDIESITFGNFQNAKEGSYLHDNYADSYTGTFDVALPMYYKSIGYFDPGYPTVFYFNSEEDVIDWEFQISLLTEQDPPCS
jgi:hypothetical protein